MRKIVKEGYEKGDYPGVFRRKGVPTEMEKRFLDLLLSQCPSDPRILDLGCGTGIPVDRYLAAQGAQITGLDISPKHIALAIATVPSALYIEADFSRIDLVDRTFDAVVSLYAIFHIPRQEHKALFAKINDLLKAKGVLLATLGTSGSEYAEEADWTGAPMVWSTYEPKKYGELLVDAGFELSETQFEGQPGDDECHFWVLARKCRETGS